jgi:hypothetical protein
VAAAAGDMDGTGNSDIAFGTAGQVILFRDNSKFIRLSPTWGGATKLHFADADGDCKAELYKLKADDLWRMEKNSAWQLILGSQSAGSINALGSVDLDSDGKDDLILQQNGVVLVSMNNSGQFNTLIAGWDGGVAEGFAFGTLD